MPPGYTEGCNYVVTFVWDSSSWPEPADDICDRLEFYCETQPDEPEHLVEFDEPYNLPEWRPGDLDEDLDGIEP